jgi:hypothetical protein
MRYAISCVVNFYNAGVVTRDRRIGSCVKYKFHPKQRRKDFCQLGIHMYVDNVIGFYSTERSVKPFCALIWGKKLFREKNRVLSLEGSGPYNGH